MDILRYTKTKDFKLFGKWLLFSTTEYYSEYSQDEVEDDLEQTVVQISEEYYKDEFEVDEYGDTE